VILFCGLLVGANMKSKAAELSKATNILTERLKSNNGLIEQINLINQDNLLSRQSLEVIKANKFSIKELENLLSEALSDLILLKNTNLILEEINNDTAKYLGVIKTIKAVINKHKPSISYIRAWSVFLEYRIKHSKNPSLPKFTNAIDENSIHIEPETVRKYWREFRKKIDSGLYLLELTKK
jgi:hypothetical protein